MNEGNKIKQDFYKILLSVNRPLYIGFLHNNIILVRPPFSMIINSLFLIK